LVRAFQPVAGELPMGTPPQRLGPILDIEINKFDRGGRIMGASDTTPSDDDQELEEPIPGINVEEVLLRFARLTGSQVFVFEGPDWKLVRLEDNATDEEIRADDEARRERRLARQARRLGPDPK
jgi:hypothetical protein